MAPSGARTAPRTIGAKTGGPGPKRAPVRTTVANAQLATRIAACRLPGVCLDGQERGGARSRSGARCTATRARNRPFERLTHATAWASGVVCAMCAGSPGPMRNLLQPTQRASRDSPYISFFGCTLLVMVLRRTVRSLRRRDSAFHFFCVFYAIIPHGSNTYPRLFLFGLSALRPLLTLE